MIEAPCRRPIRSYVLRAGRLTPAQARALEQLAPRYLLELPPAGERLNLPAAFGRAVPTAMEIGFGNGEALAALAGARPDWNLVGIEVYPPGVGHLLGELERLALGNVRVLRADARAVLEALPDASLDEIYVLFPDPWPKARHHKRRLVDAAFARAAARLLRPEGVLRLATDWEDYAQQMEAVLRGAPELEQAEPAPRPATKYERRAIRLGHALWEFAARRR